MSPPEMPRELLALARRDYEAALILAHAENPQKDAAGFHLQQSVEKSLKAWLALRGIDYPRTHDLNVLLGLLEDQDEEVGPYWPLLELNPFAVQFRYELPGEEFPNFEQLARLSEQLLMHVESIA
ncbi:HEPN domain-containing protein [Anaerobaca lacustris]|uniref:HEPN domain-containing protein n=1 Tax=Anaerobaca lacustris TaxID=3044600 RepID=A0AAW6U4W7_9BACT|nr:HEPN domain-containing protein [Sedimentisphaerales bacterium M17dextr]